MTKRYLAGIIRGSQTSTSSQGGMYDMPAAAQARGSDSWPVAISPDELFAPQGTTLLLGMKFNGSSPTITGTYNVTTVSANYSATGGVRNTGHLTAPATIAGAFQVTELITTANCLNKTYSAWYKGTQTAVDGGYSPAVPLFGHNTGAVYWGLGISGGRICVSNGTDNKGTTYVNTGTAWFHLAWTVTSGSLVTGYVNGVQEVQATVNGSNPGTDRIGGGYPYSPCVPPTAMDAVQIFNGILTAGQITQIYQAAIM